MTISEKLSSGNAPKPVKTQTGGKLKLILSKLSGAFMLPISVMAIAGLFLGVGATIEGNAGSNEALQIFGSFVKNLGDPVFNVLPLLFAAAFVVAFTNEAGVGVFATIVGYATFVALQSALIQDQVITTTFESQAKFTEFIEANSNVNYTRAFDINDAGQVIYKAIEFRGYKVLFLEGGRDALTMKNVVGSSLGFKSLQTSVFGGLVVGLIVSYLYNKFHTIQLPQVIAFFGGKRFVSLITIVAMIPLALIFLLLWPWVGVGLTEFGKFIGKTPFGFESFIFGWIERSLIPFGLHHAFYAPLWYTSAGGDLNNALIEWSKDGANVLSKDTNLLAIKGLKDWVGDSTISVNSIKLPYNSITWTPKGGTEKTLPLYQFLAQELGIKVGRYLQGKYSLMQFALPAAAAAMIMAAPKENRRVAMGTIIPSAITSLVTGVTEPIEFTFLFLAPYLFWVFHAGMAALSFLLMNVLGAHIGMVFSGGLLDLVIYGVIPFAKGTNFWIYIPVGLAFVPIYYVVFYFVIKKFNLPTPGRGGNVKLFTKADFQSKGKTTSQTALSPQLSLIVAGMGGWENIQTFNNCASRLRYDVKDISLVSESTLKQAGAQGVKLVGSNHVQAIFGPVAEQYNAKILSLKGTELAPLALMETKQHVEVAKPVEKQAEMPQPVVEKVVESKSTETKVKEPKVMETKVKEVKKPALSTKVYSIVENGKVKTLESLNDGVFSEKMMGEGVVVAVNGKLKVAKYYAPLSGTLETVFPTGHAYGIKDKDGVTVLVHIGLDTVNLNGKGFDVKVTQGDFVKAGDLLVEVDLQYVRQNAPSADTIVVVTPESSKLTLKNVKYGPTKLGNSLFNVK